MEIIDLVSRRRFLTAAAAIPLAASLRAEAPTGRIIRMRAPENLEMNFASLSGFQTATSDHYIRNHFPVPKINPGEFRLTVEGAVERPGKFSLTDLQKLGETREPVTLECAGNGRVFLTPAVRGVAWQLGAVGTAEWTGVALSTLLNKVGVASKAVEVIFEGADSGVVADPASPGAIPFARSIPIAKAMKPEVRLVWGMNGKDLLPAHGAPLRAIVGGWYGMASVKWVTRILVVERPFQGFWQSLDYTWFERVNGMASLVPLTEIPVKSQIARPVLGQVIPAGKPFTISGAAWAGESDIAKVEVSVDGGTAWHPARLTTEARPFCWRLWEYEWTRPTAGRKTLMARATDRRGRTQPMDRSPDFRTYMIHHCLPIDVTVE